MPTPTFAESMVTKIEAVLLANVGAKQVSFDGMVVSYDDLEKKYQFWERRVLVESGARPRAARIELGGF